MGRKAGPDKEKLDKIRMCLRKNPKGIWIREIARQTGLSRSTVHRYLTEFMQSEVSMVSISGLVKLYRFSGRGK